MVFFFFAEILQTRVTVRATKIMTTRDILVRPLKLMTDGFNLGRFKKESKVKIWNGFRTKALKFAIANVYTKLCKHKSIL